MQKERSYFHLKLLLLEHSYVRDLAKTGVDTITVNNGFKYHLYFNAIPGTTIPELLRLDDYIPYILEVKPDIILLIVGGNDLKLRIHFWELGRQYNQLCYKLTNLPGTKLVIGAEIEQRYHSSVANSRSSQVDYTNWSKLRNAINRNIKIATYASGFIQLVGPGRLTQSNFFNDDGVHLTEEGLHRYLELIGRSLRFCVFKNQFQIANILRHNYNHCWNPKTLPIPD